MRLIGLVLGALLLALPLTAVADVATRDAVKKGTTDYIALVYIERSDTPGVPLTGLVFNTGSLTCYYARTDQGNANATQISLVTATRGTYTSSGFIEKDATNMPGWYEIGLPPGVVAAGAPKAIVHCKGAANMAAAQLHIDLVDNTAQDTYNAIAVTGMSELVQAAPSATPTLQAAIMALYMVLRNQTLTTSGQISYTNNAGTVIFKCSLADTGTTFIKSQCGSGP